MYLKIWSEFTGFKDSVLTGQHVDVGTVRNGENVGWNFITALATVHLSTPVGIYREPLVRVDSDAEQARIGL